jgi:hypothetical protein
MQDGRPEPERIDLRLILGGALETDDLSLEHDTLVVSFELKRRVAEDIRAAGEASSSGTRRRDGAAAEPS